MAVKTSSTDENVKNEDEFLAFQLGIEEYAINIMKVQEIRYYEKVTYIRNSPEFIPGVINLRGMVIPLIDMRILFNLERKEYNELTLIILLTLSSQRIVGMIVDSVSDVIKLKLSEIKTSSDLAAIIHSNYIQGMVVLDNKSLIVLDVEKLFSVMQLNALDEALRINKEKLEIQTDSSQGVLKK